MQVASRCSKLLSEVESGKQLKLFSSQVAVAGTGLLQRRQEDEHQGVPETQGTGGESSRRRPGVTVINFAIDHPVN